MNSEQRQALGAWLRAKRAESSLTRIAEQFGVSKSAWQRYETGEREPTFELRMQLHAAYQDLPVFARPVIGAPMASPRVEEARSNYRYGGRANGEAGYVASALRARDIDLAEHSVYAALLFDLSARQLISNEAIDALLDWFVRFHIGRASTLVAERVGA